MVGTHPLLAVFLPASPFPSSQAAGSWNHLPNKLPALESLPQHACLGEPNLRQLTMPSSAIYYRTPGFCKVYSLPEFLGVPKRESHMFRSKSRQLPRLWTCPPRLLFWATLHQPGMLLFLLFMTISVDFHFSQKTSPLCITEYHFSYQPLLPPFGYQGV